MKLGQTAIMSPKLLEHKPREWVIETSIIKASWLRYYELW